MKTIKNILYVALFGLLPFAVVSCDEDDDYTPGEEAKADNMGVYFAGSNESEFVKTETDERTIQLKVVRERTEEAVTIPLEITRKTDNIEVPSTIEFAEGESETWLTITYTDLETSPQCEICIPEEYTDPYKIKDGAARHSISIYRLKVISENVTYEIDGTSSSADLFSGVTSAIYQYEGQNIFIWRNFMGSGIELKFKIDGTFNKDDLTKCYGGLVPLNHFYEEPDEDDGEIYGWYLVKDADSKVYDPVTWTPEGSDTGIGEYIYFWYELSGYYYFYIDFTDYGGYSYMYIDSAVIDESGNFNSYYVYINY